MEKALLDEFMNLPDIPEQWDVIIIGGGITGAGLLREATDMQLRALLIEKDDFASKTSSYSSKLVHGGLRYLKQGHLFLTRDSVRERERLMREAPGLVEKLAFLMPVYQGVGTNRWMLKLGLSVYDLIALKKRHRFLNVGLFQSEVPGIRSDRLVGGFQFFDAQVDDARLVLRLINESTEDGATALNYTTAVNIARNRRGQVHGIDVSDTETDHPRTLKAPVVINATGAWAETIHPTPDRHRYIRALKGSHLVFPASLIPITQAVSFTHPADRRPIFLFPWEGAVIYGTTDVDHGPGLSTDPSITREEAEYLMEGIRWVFPFRELTLHSCLSAYSGIRPVLSAGNRDASKESREHAVWEDNGLVTITGGKLTTFRLLAKAALSHALKYLPSLTRRRIQKPKSVRSFKSHGLSARDWNAHAKYWELRLLGRYGYRGKQVICEKASTGDLEKIPGSHTLWAELPFVSADAGVRHLDDILLRRVRMGLVAPKGGIEHLDRIGKLILPVLGWSKERWERECSDYAANWKRLHCPPV